MKIFWSWQSDTDGRTGRFFVRDALNAAIATLKQPNDVEEPPEAARLADLHLDHDRKGVPGSPDLMREIWAKIDAAAVVVADVTPVSRIAGRLVEGRRTPGKRNMNPNVAIELGYAIRAHTDRKVLLVLNTHHGGRQYLPFDIAQKAGPLTYCLAPDADAATLDAERSRFQGQLVGALREFLRASAPSFSQPFVPAPCASSPAVFFGIGEPLARFGEHHDAQDFTVLTDHGAYLRLAPLVARPSPFAGAELERAVRRFALDAFGRTPEHRAAVNAHGAASVHWSHGEDKVLSSLTQVFRTGELWGFASWMLVNGAFGRFIPLEGVERTYLRTLTSYLRFAQDYLGLEPPFTVTAGAAGIDGHKVAEGTNQDFWLGPIRDPAVEVTARLATTGPQAVEEVVRRIVAAFRRVAGGD